MDPKMQKLLKGYYKELEKLNTLSIPVTEIKQRRRSVMKNIVLLVGGYLMGLEYQDERNLLEPNLEE